MIRRLPRLMLWIIACCCVGIVAAGLGFLFFRKNLEPIKVGVLHSLTGSLAVTEKPLVDVVLMAIDEINKRGGVLGRQIVPVVVDGKSNDEVFKKAAIDLIQKEKVDVIFGPWRSTTRKMLAREVEKFDKLMFYPAHDEGLEESRNVIYTGSMPNQVVLPAITWCFFNLGKRFFLVGTDSLFQRVVNEIITLHIAALGGEIVGHEYIMQESEINKALEKVVAIKPDVIINTLDAQMNIPFFNNLRAVGITSTQTPTMSFGLSETELQYLGIAPMIGDYAAWTYFQSIYREENIDFVRHFKERYGKDKVISSNMESSYINVYLWANAVRDARSLATATLRLFVKKQTFDGPGSIVYLADNMHAWRVAFIGKIRFDGQFDVIWDSKKQISPLAYPPYKTKKEWEQFVTKLYKPWSDQ